MVKKLVVLAVFFVALCFTGVGCYRGGAHVVVDDGLYYDGPYRFGGGLYYSYNGGFYVHEGGAYRFHHHAPQDQRGHYDDLAGLGRIFRDEMQVHFRTQLLALWNGELDWTGESVNYRLDGELPTSACAGAFSRNIAMTGKV